MTRARVAPAARAEPRLGARRSCRGQGGHPCLDRHQSVPRQRLHRVCVELDDRALGRRDEAQRVCAPLPERPREGRLLAQRLVAAAARRTRFGGGADRATWNAPDADGRAEIHQRWAAANEKSCPVRSWIRRTFVSTGKTLCPRAKLETAAAV